MIKRKDWKWIGTPGHFICADRCVFRLCTDIGRYRISTVGAYYPTLKSKTMELIASNRHYETMVFPLLDNGAPDFSNEMDLAGLVFRGDPDVSDEQASKMHLEMCLQWAGKQ